MNEITVKSTIDGSSEPSLFYYPEGLTSVPLLVGLHTWSADRFNQVEQMVSRCRELGWALLLPEFRGPNLDTNPRALEACGSTLAKQDIIDAVDYVQEQYDIDNSKVMILGGSGGGHMTLMMAGYAPERWAAASSWCPITDLAKWHQQGRYVPHVEASTGGKPGESVEIDQRYKDKSPVSYIENIAKTNISVHHGRFDPSVNYSHTMELIAEVEKCNPKRFFFEIFDGGHELRYDQAFIWLQGQIATAEATDDELTK